MSNKEAPPPTILADANCKLCHGKGYTIHAPVPQDNHKAVRYPQICECVKRAQKKQTNDILANAVV